jgi:MMP 1-O-methyltransferase
LSNAGQTCTAPDYVLAFNDVVEPFLKQLKAAVFEFYGRDPQKSPDYARIVNGYHFNRLLGLLEGGTVHFGGQHDAPVMRDEVFGPILACIDEVDHVRDAADFHQRLSGLGHAVFCVTARGSIRTSGTRLTIGISGYGKWLCRPDSIVDCDRMSIEHEAERTRQRAALVDGWLSDAQGRALFQAAAKTAGRGAIVEIGSWKGRSTTWLASGARLAGHRVYAIDPHRHSREYPEADTLDEFLGNLARNGLADVVEPLVMTSEEAAARITAPVELLFIDGDHSYAAVRRDAELWLPRLIEGGTVMFHDVATAGYDGPRRIVREMVCRSPLFHEVSRVGSMLVARRTAHRGPRAAIWGTTAGLLLYLYDCKRALRRLRD